MRKSRVPTTSIASQFDLSWVSVVVVQVSGHFGLGYKSRWLVYIPIYYKALSLSWFALMVCERVCVCVCATITSALGRTKVALCRVVGNLA